MNGTRPPLTNRQLFRLFCLLTLAYTACTILFYSEHPMVSVFMATLGINSCLMAIIYRKHAR